MSALERWRDDGKRKAAHRQPPSSRIDEPRALENNQESARLSGAQPRDGTEGHEVGGTVFRSEFEQGSEHDVLRVVQHVESMHR